MCCVIELAASLLERSGTRFYRRAERRLQ